jgi:hypothetical protein
VADVWAIQATLAPDGGTGAERQAQFQVLQEQFQQSHDPIRHHMGRVMASFAPGLFVGEEEADMPQDNLDLERWFRQPKGHERRIHASFLVEESRPVPFRAVFIEKTTPLKPLGADHSHPTALYIFDAPALLR